MWLDVFNWKVINFILLMSLPIVSKKGVALNLLKIIKETPPWDENIVCKLCMIHGSRSTHYRNSWEFIFLRSFYVTSKSFNHYDADREMTRWFICVSFPFCFWIRGLTFHIWVGLYLRPSNVGIKQLYELLCKPKSTHNSK